MLLARFNWTSFQHENVEFGRSSPCFSSPPVTTIPKWRKGRKVSKATRSFARRESPRRSEAWSADERQRAAVANLVTEDPSRFVFFLSSVPLFSLYFRGNR